MNKYSALLAAGLMLLATLLEEQQQDPKDGTNQDLRIYSLVIAGDGSVTLKVREGRDEKIYQAKSLEDFKKQYPDIAGKYHLDVASDGDKAPAGKDFDVWKRWLDERWFWDKDGDTLRPFEDMAKDLHSDALDRWIERQRKLFEEFRAIEPPVDRKPQDSGPTFGVGVKRMDDTLADQLGLGSKEGVVIIDVLPGSAAAKSGLAKHDIVLKINGNAVSDVEAFRAEVQKNLGKGFDLEVIRRGKALKVPVSAAK